MKRRIGVVTTSRADYSHLYWPLRLLSEHPDVDLRLIAMASHLSPEFGSTIREIEKDGFPIAARIESLLSSDTDIGMAKGIGVAVLSLADTLGALPGVVEVHDLHIWAMSTTETALTAHLVMPANSCEPTFLAEACRSLHEKFDVDHTTLQIDPEDAPAPCALAPDEIV